MKLKVFTLLSVSLLSSVISGGVLASDPYPAKPIRFILPYPVGGSYDAVTRVVGNRLTDRWGQPVVVDNRPGAAGELATAIAAQAPADGYNIVMFGNSQTVLPSIDPKVRFDIVRNFKPVTRVATVTQVIGVNPSVPVQSIKELLALAQSKPGQLNFGSGGSGGVTHLAGELLKSMAKVNIVHVPYKGQVPALLALLQNDVQILILNLVTAIPQVQAGKIKPLAVTSLSRSNFMPTVPTASESGLPGYESIEWYGILVPSGTADTIIAKLHLEISKIMQLREVQDDLRKMGANPIADDTPVAFGRFIKADLAKYQRIVEEAGLKMDRR